MPDPGIARTMLRGLLRRIVPHKERNRGRDHVPDFSDAAFRRAASSIAPAPREGNSRSDPEPNNAIAHALRARRHPVPLISPVRSAELARTMASAFPAWKTAVVEAARRLLRDGTDVYAQTGPVLQSVGEWRNTQKGPGGDALYPIRPHRFAFLPQLALAALYGEVEIDAINRSLESWMQFAQSDGAPLAYVSNLVAAQRFIASSMAWGQICGCSETPSRIRCETLLLKTMFADAGFLVPRIGQSVANNHLLVDGFIGWYVCALLPELDVVEGKLESFEQLFLREMQRQTLPDGTGFEHSLHYHEMCCELACAYLLWKRKNGDGPPAWLMERTRHMLEFQLAMASGRAEPWPIGDTAEDPLFPLDPGSAWATPALRELYRRLFDPSLPAAIPAQTAAMRAFWMLGELAPAADADSIQRRAVSVFPDGGFIVFTENDRGHQLVLRTGPKQGHEICAGHMHADLLSVYLSVAGKPCIVEAGTYSYRLADLRTGAKPVNWRAYFMGPRAHNGPCIENADPIGELRGDFRPMESETRVQMSRLFESESLCGAEGKIVGANAYGGCTRGVVHVRGEYYIVYDRRPPSGDAVLSYGFQFASDVQVEGAERRCLVRSGSEQVALNASNGLMLHDIACGRESPPAGWISQRYGQLAAAPQARFEASTPTAVTAFLISIDAKPVRMEIEAAAVMEDALHFRITGPGFIDHVLLSGSSGYARIAGMELEGDALWLRDRGGMPDARLSQAGGARFGEWTIRPRESEAMRTTKTAAERAASRRVVSTGDVVIARAD